MQIEFEELPVALAGMDAFCLAGRFEVSDDGVITGVWIEEWGARRGVKPKLTAVHHAADGLSRLFWHLLRPLLRQRFADQIAAHIRDEPGPSWADEHRIGTFETLGVR